MSEVWKPVVGYETLYEVSSEGRVRAIFDGGWANQYKAGRFKKASVARNGYLVINLYRPPGRSDFRQCYVHRLVIEAFIGPIPKGAETRHLDGNRQNPRLDNLVVGTCSENQEDKKRHGTMPIGDNHWNFKMTSEVLERIKVLRAEGLTMSLIGKLVGVSHASVSRYLATGNYILASPERRR